MKLHTLHFNMGTVIVSDNKREKKNTTRKENIAR